MFGSHQQTEDLAKPPPMKGMYSVGTAVVARDLISRMDLNGKSGVVRESKGDRVIVDFSGANVSVKETNLMPLNTSASTDLKNILNRDYHPYNERCSNAQFQISRGLDVDMSEDEPEDRNRDLADYRESIIKKLDQFNKARSQLPNIRTRLEKAQSAIAAAQRDADDRRQILDRELDQYEIEKVNEVLAKTHRTSASTFDVQTFQNIKTEREQEDNPSKINEEVQERLKTYSFYEKESMLRTMEYTNQLIESERATLNNTIENLRQEIMSQQKLTGQIVCANATLKLQQEQMW